VEGEISGREGRWPWWLWGCVFWGGSEGIRACKCVCVCACVHMCVYAFAHVCVCVMIFFTLGTHSNKKCWIVVG